MNAIARAIERRAAWVLPLIVGGLAFVPAAWALYTQTFATFGRDQGIFQYVAWALRHGDRAYQDVHEINGPLPHAWYVALQLLGGEDEHVFRTIDTAFLAIVYALSALTIPRWVELAPGAGEDRRRVPGAWILAGVGVLGAQYARYDWWHTAQREALYAALVLGSLALQSLAHSARTRPAALRLFGLAGLATALTWFGKPPCAIFALLQAGVAILDRKSLPVSLRAAAAAAATGAAVSAAAMLAFVLRFGDLGRGIDILSNVPRLHHTIWNETLAGAYRAYRNGPRLDWAAITFVVFAIVFFATRLPRRALLGAVLPVGGFIVFAGQGKAFPYHLHMLTLGTAVMQLMIVAALARSLATPRRPAIAIACAVVALGVGAKSAEDAWLAPSVVGRWAIAGATAEQRATRAYLDRFPWGDFFANDLRDAAAYLTFRTRPDERVQLYGFDPYLLFLARRKSASPVIYGFELNVDAAIAGGPGARPSESLRAWLRAYRDQAEDVVLRAVEASPPAAFALLDRAPFSHPEDAEVDFASHCPRLHAFMVERYVPSATFGAVRVWLRRDVHARAR